MWKGGIYAPGVLKILTQQFAGGARSVVRRVEIAFHDERLFRTTVAKCATENETLRCSRFAVRSAIAAVANTHPRFAQRSGYKGAVGRHASLRPQGDGYKKTAHKIDSVISAFAKKPGGKLDSPPGVEVRGCDPESFRDRYQASGLSASFSSLIFSSLLSFSLPSTIPPFQSATCGDV